MQAAGLIVSGRRTSRCAVIQTARVASPHLPCASRFIEAVQRLNRTTSASRQACGLAGCTGPSATRRSCPPPHVHNDLRPTPGLGCRVTTIRLGGHLDGSRATATATRADCGRPWRHRRRTGPRSGQHVSQTAGTPGRRRTGRHCARGTRADPAHRRADDTRSRLAACAIATPLVKHAAARP